MSPDKVIEKMSNSNVPHISEGPHMCLIIYDTESDKFVVDRRLESITGSEKDEIDVFCKDNGIDNLLIFHNNTAMKNTENYHSFPYFYLDIKAHMEAWPQYGKVNLKSKKEKIYNCLNHAVKNHRTFLFDNLKSKNLLNYGFVSYGDKGIVLPQKIDPVSKFYTAWTNHTWDHFSYYVTEKSYFNVVTETRHEFDNPQHGGLHITEKTVKALISQPFIVVGQYGHLEKLREQGFETYPELFDESYDLIENPSSRLNLIIGEIERLCNMNKNELEEIYKSVLWKIEHNRKRMFDFEKDEFAYKYFDSRSSSPHPQFPSVIIYD